MRDRRLAGQREPATIAPMDLETAIERLAARVLKADGFRLPLYVASIAANGAVLFTRFEQSPPGSPPGTITSEHVTGEVGDDGFQMPVHLMIKDATGRIRIARHTGQGAPTLIDLAE